MTRLNGMISRNLPEKSWRKGGVAFILLLECKYAWTLGNVRESEQSISNTLYGLGWLATGTITVFCYYTHSCPQYFAPQGEYLARLDAY